MPHKLSWRVDLSSFLPPMCVAICSSLFLTCCSGSARQPTRDMVEDIVARDKSGKIHVVVESYDDRTVRMRVDGSDERVVTMSPDSVIYGPHGLKGRWLIMGCSIYGIEDIANVIPAVEEVQARGDGTRIGLIAFRSAAPVEILPAEVRGIKSHTTPVWVFIVDGKAVHFVRGPLPGERIRHFLTTVFDE
jgi:hypothetical protein